MAMLMVMLMAMLMVTVMAMLMVMLLHQIRLNYAIDAVVMSNVICSFRRIAN